jgi:hypothetical protein
VAGDSSVIELSRIALKPRMGGLSIISSRNRKQLTYGPRDRRIYRFTKEGELNVGCAASERVAAVCRRPRSLRSGAAEGMALLFKFLYRIVMPGSVGLDKLLGLLEARAQCVAKLGVGNSVLPVKFEEVQLACFPFEIRPFSADLRFDFVRDLEADRNHTFPERGASRPVV